MFDELTVRVSEKKILAQDITSFEFSRIDGLPLPPFSAGSHVDVHIPGGITRQYSLCNDPDETHRYEIAVLKSASSRGGSAAMHDSLKVGSELKISLPRNLFPLAECASRNILIAGGIGITPIISMAEQLSRTKKAFELHYCARSPERAAFTDRIFSSSFSEFVRFYYSDSPLSSAHHGRADMRNLIGAPSPSVHLYTCGPQAFMEHVLDTARAKGWDESHLHHEFFSAASATSDKDAAFEVELASSGRVIRVDPSQTIVEALAGCGIQVPTSCEQGVCGTCLTTVLAGVPDHRDVFLLPDERARNDRFLPCCSRSASARLVLDL